MLLEKIKKEIEEETMKFKKLPTEQIAIVINLSDKEIEEFNILKLDQHWSWEKLSNNRVAIRFIEEFNFVRDCNINKSFKVFGKSGEGSLYVKSIKLHHESKSEYSQINKTFIEGKLSFKNKEFEELFEVVTLNDGISLRLQNSQYLNISKNESLLNLIWESTDGDLGFLLQQHTKYRLV